MTLLLMRWRRILSGIIGSILFFFSRLRNRLVFKYMTLRHGISNGYIWEAFSYLAGLDMTTGPDGYGGDGFITDDGLEFYGCGFYFEMKQRGKREDSFILQQVGPTLIAQRWKEKAREVTMEHGLKHQTHWWEIYRSNSKCEITDTRDLIAYLRKLYGNGKDTGECHSQKKN